MSALITAHGDPSAGIPEATWEIDGDLFQSEEDRFWVRNELIECFSEIAGELVSVSFSDEFPYVDEADDYE